MNKVSKVSVSQGVRLDCCHRCGGLMVPEQVHDLGSFVWHCVSCGERIDPVILAHRQKDLARGEAEKLLAGHGKSRLN
jgi:DNA-directed RNA polymerase subunit M/transcription elongation factor TFIIS